MELLRKYLNYLKYFVLYNIINHGKLFIIYLTSSIIFLVKLIFLLIINHSAECKPTFHYALLFKGCHKLLGLRAGPKGKQT